MFDDNLFKFDTDLVPEAVQLYAQLNSKHEPLALITPKFEKPLPPFTPSVFPPAIREPPPPALELFDLDEQFASEPVRLAQVTNKCDDGDLEYYIRECGDILGVTDVLDDGKKDARHILEYVLKQLVDWKKLESE
eukprot:TRINITY_DN1279_c0_g1_i1.p1 TRINITY_DN1279_c0_g1~~TRINITY_DN1279_c0_g1_i1.p1  ORF type:complete len:135 (+),score=59.05 TRINITY_DN1279_c0_g1_i1:231-635(+)